MSTVLIVGEICADFSLAGRGSSSKLRLGGIVHAARGLWACGISYAVAAVCPEYLAEEAKNYLKNHGCIDFIRLGDITGAPNVFIIGDVKETGHQGYENILRDCKKVKLFNIKDQIENYSQVVIFPGSFSLGAVLDALPLKASITVDIAYDVQKIEDLKVLDKKVEIVAISTSSELFQSVANANISPLLVTCKEIGAKYLLVKENRGGSRFFNLEGGQIEEIPAVLGETVNSVGVGDVYTAVLAAFPNGSREEAVWRGMQAATKYAQTTFPDDLQRDIQREYKLSVDEVRQLGGTSLPWHDRGQFDIYLAAPDFSYGEKTEINEVVSALGYHNFKVRRPILENGEAVTGSDRQALQEFYHRDIELLKKSSLIFAIPLRRDPGTLVEVGIALAMNKPIITYDPYKENNNTMVICGSNVYSDDLDSCLNGVFEALSVVRKKNK